MRTNTNPHRLRMMMSALYMGFEGTYNIVNWDIWSIFVLLPWQHVDLVDGCCYCSPILALMSLRTQVQSIELPRVLFNRLHRLSAELLSVFCRLLSWFSTCNHANHGKYSTTLEYDNQRRWWLGSEVYKDDVNKVIASIFELEFSWTLENFHSTLEW